MRNKKQTVKIFLLGLVLLSFFGILGKMQDSSELSSLHQRIDEYLQNNQFQGTVLVVKEGKILFNQAYGYANVEHQIPNTLQTIFRIGSITKTFTAIAILQLQEKGLLKVNDTIDKFLPGYPQGQQITIHHLLSHSSGIPSITHLPNLSEIQRQPTTPQLVIKYFKDKPLKFAPGTDFEYSDSNYILLGAIIETVSKQSYADYLQAHLFLPLGMHSTYYDFNHLIIPRRASGYQKDEKGSLQHAHFIDMSFPHAAGALVSTVEDLYALSQKLKEMKNSLCKIYGVNSQRQIAYGYGCRVGPQNRGMEDCQSSIIGHFGSIDGFEAALIHYLDEDLTLILLSNVEKMDVRSFHKSLAHFVRTSWR